MEAEEVLIGAGTWIANKLGLFRSGDRARPPGYALSECKTRLQHLLRAVFDRDIPIFAANPPAPPTVLKRLFAGAARSAQPLPGTDGRAVYLPAVLTVIDPEAGFRVYRLLALQQAARLVRGVSTAGRDLSEPERHWLLLNEALSIDADLLRTLPGLHADIVHFRSGLASSARNDAPVSASTRLYRLIVQSPPQSVPAPFIHTSCAEDSKTLARQLLTRPEFALTEGLAADLFIGQLLAPPPESGAGAASPGDDSPGEEAPRPQRIAKLARRPDVREEEEGEDDQQDGPWMIQTNDPIEHVEDPFGMQRPADRDSDADPEGLGESLAELERARLKSTPDKAREILLSESGDLPRARHASLPTSPSALSYPEWDFRKQAYLPDKVSLYLSDPQRYDPAWLRRTSERQRDLIRTVEKQFAALKPKRVVKSRLADGEEIDLDASVQWLSERRYRQSDEQRVYQRAVPARRDIAVAVLLDASASTDAWLYGQSRIVDVEKEALLILGHALKQLDCAFALYAYSGKGPQRVELLRIKTFQQAADAQTLLKISAIEPQDYTRTGAAIRYVSDQLQQQSARHRLLVVLTDGKPNDVDEYEGRYGLEDTRRAVDEALQAKLLPYCLTIDRSAPAYMAQLFGAHRYALLPHPERLPQVLADFIRRLISA